jgi:hypothetical protein
MQVVARRKMQLFGHITRMDNSRKIKAVMQGIIEGKSKRGRPPREWLDDIEYWCQKDINMLSHMAQDRMQWAQMICEAVHSEQLTDVALDSRTTQAGTLDTNGSSHCS